MAKGKARTDRRGDGVADRTGGDPLVSRAKVRIRAARESDAPALVRLRAQAERAHADLLPDYFRATGAAGAMVVPSGDGPAVLLLAEADVRVPRTGSGPSAGTPVPSVTARSAAAPSAATATVLGYVSVNVVETPADRSMTPQRRAYVDVVVVDERQRRAGIGTELMRAAADWARRRGAAELVLTVWNENAAAEALYRRLGYRPIARVLRHILDG